jgi:hypothetical protein
MGSWVLVPESFHDDSDALDSWIRKAHSQALPKDVKLAKKAPKVKPALTKSAASKSAASKSAAPKSGASKSAPSKKTAATKKASKKR